MQRVHSRLGFDCACRSDERLTGNLPTEDSLLFRRGTDASEHIDFDGFEIKKGEECVYCGLSHPPNLPH